MLGYWRLELALSFVNEDIKPHIRKECNKIMKSIIVMCKRVFAQMTVKPLRAYCTSNHLKLALLMKLF
jgi:hypothetical protein